MSKAKPKSKPAPKPKLLIVEDDRGLQRQLRWSFENYDAVVAEDRKSALAKFESEAPAVVTLDFGLPPDPDGASEGLATLEEILALDSDAKVIVVTGNEDREHALRAIQLGAYDFYQKPIDVDVLRLIVDRAFRLRELERENRALMTGRGHSPLDGLITADPEMLKVCAMIEKVAPANVSVMLLGESGTGKELLARALHELGPRSGKTFAAINCAAIPENLIESELFGHEKGAFTGAHKQVKGKIEIADGGTLFLDEVGDLPLALQVKLLRFLQERVIERVGGRQPISVDVRVVCATHQDLDQLIAQDLFREDLYYRLCELVIRIPPLRDREGDAVLLAHTFMGAFNAELGRSVKGFRSDALAALAEHNWPGNVRELENRMKRAVIMAESTRISAADLDLDAGADDDRVLSLKEAREAAERREIPRALSQSDGNVSKAAKLLGVSRPTLYDLMRHHGIKMP